jgi:hypothetical protein
MRLRSRISRIFKIILLLPIYLMIWGRSFVRRQRGFRGPVMATFAAVAIWIIGTGWWAVGWIILATTVRNAFR